MPDTILPQPAPDLPAPVSEEPYRHRPGRPVGTGGPQAMTRITHDAIIDYLVANPHARRQDIATAFGYKSTVSISIIVNSDAFQARLAARKEQLVDPIVQASVEDRIRGLAARSAEILAEALETDPNTKLALEVFKESAKAGGYGQSKAPVAVQQNFVVSLPGPAASSSEWMNRFAPATDAVVKPRFEDAPAE